jgi:hypothetical protein
VRREQSLPRSDYLYSLPGSAASVSGPHEDENIGAKVLWTTAVVFLILVQVATPYSVGGVTYALLALAVVAVLIRALQGPRSAFRP